MNAKALVLLTLAVISGLGATYGTSRLLSKHQRKTATEMRDVLVAARDLKVEEMLKPDLVKVIKMSRNDLPAGTFTSYKDVEDRWVFIKTLEGEPILDRKLAPKGSPAGLVPRIPKGMRAFAVDVNESTGVSGFILPEHRVDVVQVMPGREGKSEAETILQDALVLASGQVFSRPEDRSIQCRTVTLAVAPEDVDVLVAAHTRGPLSLSLRGMNDHEQVQHTKLEPVKPPAPAAVAVAPAPLPPPPPAEELSVPPATERFVFIYRGPTVKEKNNESYPERMSLDRQTPRRRERGQHRVDAPQQDEFKPDSTVKE